MPDTQQPNLQPVMPNQPVQPPKQPVTPTPVPKPPSPAKVGQQIPPGLIAAAVIVLVLLILVGIAKFTQKPTTLVGGPTPTPTITPMPTPIRTLSRFATTSAFMTLDATVASYSSTVKGYNNTDPSLSPPVLDLNVAF